MGSLPELYVHGGRGEGGGREAGGKGEERGRKGGRGEKGRREENTINSSAYFTWLVCKTICLVPSPCDRREMVWK